jgi:transposase
MKTVELYARVRHAVLIEGISERAAADRFGINARTVSKMLKFSVPPGYVRRKPPFRPKLDEFTGVIDGILATDKDRPKKQRHTSKRIFERLRDEYGFTGRITIVKDYVAGWRQRTLEMFVPLVHPPGHAQADFGEAIGVIGGVERDGPAALRRDLRGGLSGRDDGSVLRRARASVRVLRWCAAVDPL